MKILPQDTTDTLERLLEKLNLPASETDITKKKIAELLELLIQFEDIQAIESQYEEALDDAFAGLQALAHSDSCEDFENLLYAILDIAGLSSDQIKIAFELLQEHQLLRQEALDFERIAKTSEPDEALQKERSEEMSIGEEELKRQQDIDSESLLKMRDLNDQDLSDELDDLMDSSNHSPLDDILHDADVIDSNIQATSQITGSYSESMFESLSSKEAAAAYNLKGATEMINRDRAHFRNALVFQKTIHGKGAPESHAIVAQINIDQIYEIHFGKRDPSLTEIESKKLDYEFESPQQGIAYPAPIITRTIQKAVQLTAVRLSGNKDASPTSTPEIWEKAIELVNALNPMSSEDTREKFLENRRDVLHAMSLISKYQNALSHGKSIILGNKDKTILSRALSLSPDAIPTNLNTRVLNTLDERAQTLNHTQTMLEFAVMQDQCPEMADLICELYLLKRPSDAKSVFNDAIGFARPQEMARALAPANMADMVIQKEMDSPFHTPTPADALPGSAAI